MANVRAESLGIGRTGFFVFIFAGSSVIAFVRLFAFTCAGFFLIISTVSVVVACAISFLIFGSGLFSLVITCAGSFVIPKSNFEGASACAYAAALEMARSDVVANAK